jgi:uncharacterized protein
MSDDNLISRIKEFALKNSERDDIHGFQHVERVFNMCIRIGKELNANLLVLKIAALLHDIGRINERKSTDNKNHAEISSEMALEFLRSNDFNLSEDIINNVIHCIKAHSFSLKLSPETLEAKILSDSDKLDAIGAIGLYRTIGFTVKNKGGIKQVIEHLEKKIMKLKDRMYLDSSKLIAESRHQIILEFYNKIKGET